MTKYIRLAGVGIFVVISVMLLSVEFADGGRGRGGGGGGRGGGGGGRGGGVSRPSGGGGISRPSGGGGISRPSGGARPGGGAINRSPGVSAPRVSQPSITRPGGGNIGGGGPKITTGGIGPRDGPGVVAGPKLTPGQRPNIGGPGIGQGPGIGSKGNIGKGVDPGFGVGKAPGIGSKGNIGKGVDPGFGVGKAPGAGIGNRPGVGTRPGGGSNFLPGLGLGAGAGLAAGKAGDYLGRRQENIQDRKGNIADRSQNMQDRLEQRQDFRNQRQDQRQDYMNNRREDWQNWHDDYYGHHDGWYHGGWCDHWGDNWSHMWSDHTAAMVLGTTMWGLNRMSYWFGYGGYSNPYYSEPLVIDNTTIDYSQPFAEPPVVVNVEQPAPATPAAPALPPGVTQEGMTQFDAARASFYEGKYPAALESTNKALVSMPKDAVIHEFRALVLFALGKYKDAATTLHPVLAVGPGWDWTTMSSLYPDVATYTKQLRALEAYVGDNPKSPDGHFVLAYQYLTCGQEEAATGELLQVKKLLPNDTVSTQLLQMLGKTPPLQEAVAESDAKIDVDKLVGTWKASRGGKANFDLTLTKDKAFTWVYREGKKKEEVKGAYALDGNVLALEPDAGGVMLAEITAPQGGSFVFRVDGAPKTDPGLTFKGK
jgi:tetratricopeptide (TPR) repeat protein